LAQQTTWIEPLSKQKIKLTTSKELRLKPASIQKRLQAFNLIAGDILKQLPRKAVVKLTKIISAIFSLRYVPSLWKVAEIIMIQPGKPPHETSYRFTSLLSMISKLCLRKLLLKRLKLIIETNNLIPDHQFDFREKHSTIDQIHRSNSLTL